MTYSRVPQSYAELCAMPAPTVTTIVEFLEDDPRFKIAKGDQFAAYPYVMDPSEKWTLVRRLSDGADPGCNAYRSQVRIVCLVKAPGKLPRLSASQLFALRAVAGSNPFQGCHGRSAHGGRGSTLFSLRRAGLVIAPPGKEWELTDAGRSLLALWTAPDNR